MARGYHIPDEPSPGALASWTVKPMWLFFALMFGGLWLAWPWWAFNGLAMGSATRVKEALWLGGTFVGIALISALAVYGSAAQWFPQAAWPYVTILLLVIKLTCVYVVFLMQSRSFAIYDYYDGRVRHPAPALVGGFLGRAMLLASVDSDFWTLVLA